MGQAWLDMLILHCSCDNILDLCVHIGLIYIYIYIYTYIIMVIPCLDFVVNTKQITHDKDNTMTYVAMISQVGHGQENENHPGSLQATT